MTNYPEEIDNEVSLPRVDDNNLVEVGAEAIEAIRGAIFAIEETLGVNPQGAMDSVADRLDVSLAENGTIRASALTSIGLVSLPITNAQVGSNAGILESKLSLSHSTVDLYTLIQANAGLLSSLISYTQGLSADFTFHLAGATYLTDGYTSARHVLSQIDVNAVPSDPRDVGYTWTGLLDKNGNLRSATQAAAALLEINNDLVGHENATSGAHPATAITVDAEGFAAIPTTATDAQAVFDYLDQADILNMGQHRATQHSNGVPRVARSEFFDGYRELVVSQTPVWTYLAHPPAGTPVDDISTGDDIVSFKPTSNTMFQFDAMFSQVKPGDHLKLTYSNAVQVVYLVDSIRFIPGTEWIVRINGTNLLESLDGASVAQIEKPSADRDTAGVLAVAAANPWGPTGPVYTNILPSVIVGSPRGAVAYGLGFNPNKLNSTHYKLWMELYPTGNPADQVVSLPFIDVTGNAGATPGVYTLDSVVEATNNNLRQLGYNYRMIAFADAGEFGIMLADAIDNAGFAIISGDNSSGTLTTGTFTENVIGGSSLDDWDALGLGATAADLASPAYQGTWSDSTAALLPTKVMLPRKHRYYQVNGRKLDTFENTYLATDGYWDGYISARTVVGISTVEVTYHVNLDLIPAGLKPGKTLVVQPSLLLGDSLYSDVDYGRFIIKSVNFNGCNCDGYDPYTEITVINGIHAAGTEISASGEPELPVKLYFGYDSVGFDIENVIDTGLTSANYGRFHEIYVDQDGKTFSHERGRFIRQAGTSELLATANNWHIVNVSPKLRGYTDGTTGIFNRYVRFYADNYDSTSGEFDGYLGKRDPSTLAITKVGQPVRTRKDVVTRFYDETNVDFVELVYQELSTSPGVDVNPSVAGRYLDIELFPSLQTDPEVFYLASCEVNWDPISSVDTIKYCLDRREFGSISEIELTQSCYDFINSVDRHLHSNVVFSGLDLESVGSDGEIYFKGGICLVNGALLAVNNQSVVIPQIYKQGTSVPQDVDWAICVNESGELESIIVTDTKIQWFSAVGNVYVESVTFAELVDARKDLVPICIVTAHIASITITATKDVRRFAGGPLTLVSSEKSGSFKDLAALAEWANRYADIFPVVTVSGEIELSSTFDLAAFTNGVHLIGDGGSFAVNKNTGFTLADNCWLENLTFNYAIPASEGVSSGNLNTSFGCLYGEELSNVRVTGCIFNYEDTSYRYPFISIELQSGDLLENVWFEGNSFNDTILITDGQYQPAITVMWAGNAATPATLSSLKICNNICNVKQSIYVSCLTDTTGGLSCLDAEVSGNNCGIIGFFTRNILNSSLSRGGGLRIVGNTVGAIVKHFKTNTSPITSSGSSKALGDVLIEDNSVGVIWVGYGDVITGTPTSIRILGNRLLSPGDEWTDYFGVPFNTAIYVDAFGATLTTSGPEVEVCENTIGLGQSAGAINDPYSFGVITGDGRYTICDNIVSGFSVSGMFFNRGFNIASNYVVTGNNINRGAETAIFITVEVNNSSNWQGVVTENSFDSSTTDGSSTNVIVGFPQYWIIDRNKNQTLNLVMDLSMAIKSINTVYIGGTTTGTNWGFGTGLDNIYYNYKTADASLTAAAYLNALAFFPNNTHFVSASVTHQCVGTVPATTATLFLRVGYADGTFDISASSAWSNSPVTVTLPAAETAPLFRSGYGTTSEAGGNIAVIVNSNGAADSQLRLSALTVQVRY